MSNEDLFQMLADKDEEIKRLKEEYMILQNASDEVEEGKDREIERLNNDIKVLLKENENKEKVIKAQDNIIKEVREYINSLGWNTTIPNIQDNVWKICTKYNEVADKINEIINVIIKGDK